MCLPSPSSLAHNAYKHTHTELAITPSPSKQLSSDSLASRWGKLPQAPQHSFVQIKSMLHLHQAFYIYI